MSCTCYAWRKSKSEYINLKLTKKKVVLPCTLSCHDYSSPVKLCSWTTILIWRYSDCVKDWKMSIALFWYTRIILKYCDAAIVFETWFLNSKSSCKFVAIAFTTCHVVVLLLFTWSLIQIALFLLTHVPFLLGFLLIFQETEEIDGKKFSGRVIYNLLVQRWHANHEGLRALRSDTYKCGHLKKYHNMPQKSKKKLVLH